MVSKYCHQKASGYPKWAMLPACRRFIGTPLVKAPRTDAPACRTRGTFALPGLRRDIALPKWTRGAVQEEGAVVFYLVNAVASARESVTAPALIVPHRLSLSTPRGSG